MNGNEKVHFYEPMQEEILEKDDAEERLTDRLESFLENWDQHIDVLITEQWIEVLLEEIIEQQIEVLSEEMLEQQFEVLLEEEETQRFYNFDVCFMIAGTDGRT